MLWILICAAVLVVIILIIAFVCYRLVFYNANILEHDPYVVPPGEQYDQKAEQLLKAVAALDALPYQQVYTTSHDGIRLAARYYHFYDDAPMQIMFHGYRSCALTDMCGGALLAKKNGCNVLLVDQRAHGKSGGHTITFGIEERCDCLDWVKYVLERFGAETKIVLLGLSMGAATVLMASELSLPKNVVGIIADCPYTSPGEIIRSVSNSIKLPGRLLYPVVALGALLYGKVCIWRGNTVRAVANAKVPILLIHGEDDRLVPWTMSQEIASTSASPATLEVFPDSGHGLCYVNDPRKYEQVVVSFLNTIPTLHGTMNDGFLKEALDYPK